MVQSRIGFFRRSFRCHFCPVRGLTFFDAEKEQLAREAGLTIKQVSDFCGNWRKRKWKGECRLRCVPSRDLTTRAAPGLLEEDLDEENEVMDVSD